MPIYEYKCTSCGKVFEVLQKHFDVDEAPCEACGQPGKRIMSNTSFVLKGSGWYVTDYKSNGGCSAAGDAPGGHKHAGSSDATTSSDAADAKPAASSCPSSGCASCGGAAASADS